MPECKTVYKFSGSMDPHEYLPSYVRAGILSLQVLVAIVLKVTATWILYNCNIVAHQLSNHCTGVNTVLDLGCGYGMITNILSKYFTKNVLIVGLDMDIKCIKYAKSAYRGSNIEYVLADAENLPFREGVFDAVFVKDLLHHAVNPEKILRQTATVCRETLKIVEANRPNPIMLLYTKYGGHNHFTFDELKYLISRVSTAEYTSFHAYPTTLLLIPSNSIIFIYDFIVLLFHIINYWLPSLSSIFVKLFSYFLPPAYNMVTVKFSPETR